MDRVGGNGDGSGGGSGSAFATFDRFVAGEDGVAADGSTDDAGSRQCIDQSTVKLLL